MSEESIRTERLRLERDINGCCACSLSEYTVNQVSKVFGNGNCINPQVFLIGMAPSHKSNSSLSDKPHRLEPPRAFQHHHGFTFRNMLKSAGLYDMIYITNVLKCSTPQNRRMKPNEKKSCLQWLQKEMELLKPKVVITMGSDVSNFLASVYHLVSGTEWRNTIELFGMRVRLFHIRHPNYCLSYHRITKSLYIGTLQSIIELVKEDGTLPKEA